MKSLSGANPESKPDYRQQALTELNKLESKVILLNEMLDNVDTTRSEKFVAGDVYDVCSASSRVTLSGIPDVLVTCRTASWFFTLQRAPKDTKVDL